MRAIYSKTMNGIIGVDGDLIIKSKADMKYFKETTTGNIVIMGRKTWNSLQVRPLPDRINIVITTGTPEHVNALITGQTCFIHPDDHDALFKILSMYPDKMTYAIGGPQTWMYLDKLNLITSRDINTFVINVMCCPSEKTYEKFIKSIVREPSFSDPHWSQLLTIAFSEEYEADDFVLNSNDFKRIVGDIDHENIIHHQILSIFNHEAFDDTGYIVKMVNSNDIQGACDVLKEHLEKYSELLQVLQTGSKARGDLTTIKKIRFNEFLREIQQNLHDVLYFNYIPSINTQLMKFSEKDKETLMSECNEFVRSHFIYE